MKPRTLVAGVGLALGLLVVDATDVWARAGRGGSRGSRSYSAPARPSPGGPTTPSSPSRSFNQPASPAAPQRPGFFGGGLMGGLAGFALGGLLGSMLFGGLGHGLGGFGGIGLLEMLLIGGAGYFLFRFLRNRQAQPAYAGATSAYGAGSERSWSPGGGATVEMPAAPSDLERGIDNIRTMDPGFDPATITDHLRRVYFVVQQAIGMRELAGVRDYLTPEMTTVLQAQCDRLRAARQTNRVEQLDIRRAEVSEAWQERGRDYVTVFIAATMVDYTVEDATGAVVDGSRTATQSIEDYWTFTRPVGNNPWKLSAIQAA
jgi:predicted lipid-binding transport protein (Tim44 family)